MAIKPTLYFLFTYNKYHQNVYLCVYLCWCAIGIACPCGCGRSHTYTQALTQLHTLLTENARRTQWPQSRISCISHFIFVYLYSFLRLKSISAVHCFCVCGTFWPSLFLSFSSRLCVCVYIDRISLLDCIDYRYERYKIYG